ncbi:MAG: DUF512 domain-containing protein [Clostridiales bacterium]|jgi:putative radical SAM enzyme (TIGR03279 family)|nr:DUF512 domain-containing protein [Clostridiales bacterium]
MKIVAVNCDSVGEELGLQPGYVLLGFNGKDNADFIDYQYFNAQEHFVMTISVGDEVVDFEIEKECDEDLGLEFDDNFSIKQCHNKCKFCFIDQNPPNLRKSLYIKDDDYRMSMLSGSFVTLTNLKDADITRILTYGLSPLYVSVHSTDNEVRSMLLGNKKVKPIMPILELFYAHGITIHAQIVYCPTINDDYIKTICELAKVVKSTAIVPVGLTKYSKNDLVSVNCEIANKVIDDIERLQKNGVTVYCSDEFYFRANRKLPDYDSYGEFEQVSNGVGIVKQFDHQFDEHLNGIQKLSGDYTIITGTLAGDLMQGIAKKCNALGANVKVVVAKSLFFGGDVSCSGLVTGGDIISACKDLDLTNQDKVIIPKTMLKEFDNIFLDDLTLSQVGDALGKELTVCPVDGGALIDIFKQLC